MNCFRDIPSLPFSLNLLKFTFYLIWYFVVFIDIFYYLMCGCHNCSEVIPENVLADELLTTTSMWDNFLILSTVVKGNYCCEHCHSLYRVRIWRNLPIIGNWICDITLAFHLL
uniref:Uncharacterized protein n=1 Tax=Octopus bimaculoides TaxID=37653 RepID=A0A0L8HB46_OCTBM